MTRLLRSEALKLRTTWAVWIYLAVVVALAALFTSLQIGSADATTLRARTFVGDTLETGGIAWLFALLLGLLGFTAEFRHGTIAETFLTAPRRERVLAVKLAVHGALGALLGAIAIGVTLAIAIPWLSARGVDVSLSDRVVWATALGVVAASGLFGAFGVGVGAAVRNQVAAVVGTLVWLLVIEHIVYALYPDVGRYLPGIATDVLASGSDGGDELSRQAAGFVALGWAAAAALVSGVLLDRRDVL